MASTSEKGHAKNIANAALIINYASQFGATYNPSNAKIKLNNLEMVFSLSKSKFQETLDLIPPYTLAVNNRENIFAPQKKKVSALRKVLKATEDVTPNLMEDFQTISRRITGARKKSINTNNEDNVHHSTAQLSYDQKVSNYSQLIDFLKNVPNYNPNETEFQIVTLEFEKNEMLAATANVNNTYIPLTNARTSRNQAMYHGNDNLIDIFNTARTYLLTIVPKNSTNYKAINKIVFTKI